MEDGYPEAQVGSIVDILKERFPDAQVVGIPEVGLPIKAGTIGVREGKVGYIQSIFHDELERPGASTLTNLANQIAIHYERARRDFCDVD